MPAGGQIADVAPAVTTAETPGRVEHPLAAHRVEERDRWIIGLRKERHRGPAVAREPARNLFEQPSPEAKALIVTADIDLVDVAVARFRRFARLPCRETHQRAVRAHGDDAEPLGVALELLLVLRCAQLRR